jgi:histidyl-tRNA synthetase
MVRMLWRELGLVVGEHVRLEINSLGQPAERQAHRQALIAHFEQHAELLDADARRRLHSNPLRILDTKNPLMQAMVEAAPKLMDFLGAESLTHFEAVRAVLDAAGLDYRVNPRLVRGMDYYNLTVFEWVTDQLGSQGTVCGGGRYDGLIEQMGGKSAPAVGFGLGVERLLLLIQELGLAVPSGAPQVYAVLPSAAALPTAMIALDQLRAAGVSVLMHAGGGGMKLQFKKADASGAHYALIFGDNELARGEVAIKPLRGGGEQRLRPLANVADWAAELRPA